MKYSPRRGSNAAQALLMAVAMMLVFGFAGMARAQTEPLADPPGRVARLSDVSGQVWLYSPDTGDWVNAVRNQPLTTGDRLATDAGARAELQVGSSTVRLDAGTELEIRNLDDDHVSLQLHSGSVTARLRESAEAAEFELATEDGRFLAPHAGRYRFDRDTSGSFATVYAGQARYEGPNSGLTINAGQRGEFWIDAAGAAQYRLDQPENDAFAAWSNERDRNADRSVSTRYVSPAMTGAEELDRYGRWEQDSDYGALWIPRGVAVGWAPYSTGHWAWVRPWGWTWIDDAPWGFAPFHYGRWVHVRNTWCWTPGQRVVRPVYAPALVAWVGGPGVSVSIAIGGGRTAPPVVGWFPLAPREVYVPSYRASPRYAQNINITHVTNVTQITTVINNPQAPREFGNRRVEHAVTVVPAAVLTSRQPVAPAASQLRDTPWVRDIAKQPARSVALVSAPVTAPSAPVRSPEVRPVRPAPGAAAASSGAPTSGTRPATPPRDRDGARPAPPASGVAPFVRPGQPAQPLTPTLPQTRPPPVTQTQPAPPPRPLPRDGRDRPSTPTPPVEPPSGAAVPRPVVPAPAPAARPTPTPAAQEAPMMRTLPVQRGDDRRAAPRSQAPAVAVPRAPVSTERPAPPARPADAVRPVAPAAPAAAVPPVPRAVEAPRPAPPAVGKVEAPPRPRVEPPKDAGEEKRDEKRGGPRERDTR